MHPLRYCRVRGDNVDFVKLGIAEFHNKKLVKMKELLRELITSRRFLEGKDNVNGKGGIMESILATVCFKPPHAGLGKRFTGLAPRSKQFWSDLGILTLLEAMKRDKRACEPNGRMDDGRTDGQTDGRTVVQLFA